MMNIDQVIKMVDELKTNGIKFSTKQKNYASEWFELFEIEQYFEKDDTYIVECSSSTLESLTGYTNPFDSVLIAVKVGEMVIAEFPKSLDDNEFIQSLIEIETDERFNEEGQNIQHIEG